MKFANPGGINARDLSTALNRFVERLCVVLLALLVMTVWLGICARYIDFIQITFTEELSRYLMIWVALLAISSGIARREHVGLTFIFESLPPPVRRWLGIAFDLISFAFFAFMCVYGVSFVERGFNSTTMILDIPKAYPYAVVPVAGFLSCAQLALRIAADFTIPGEAMAPQASEVSQ